MKNAAVVQFEGVSKRYGTFTALHPTSLRIEAGEFFSIIGPSGSGKTTLLGTTAGFVPPTTGRILVNDVDIVPVPLYRRGIGMVFQNYALFPHMTVAENIGFPLRMRGVAKAEIARRVNAMLEMVRLPAFADRRIAQLSGGQQQRVALARAAIYDPKLLLMDEPLGALDKNLRVEMQDEIKRFQQNFGCTVLYVTHDQEEAASMSDRIAIMNNGRIEQIGTAHHLYEYPRNRFVASFLGEANLLDVASVERVGEGTKVTTVDGQILDSAHKASSRSVSVCIRPEAIQMSRTTTGASNSMPARVVLATHGAGFIRYKLQLASGAELSKRAPADRGVQLFPVGTEVFVHFEAKDVLLIGDDGECNEAGVPERQSFPDVAHS
jgi:putative spermidine/putrescine transport system ATP-binding protein